MKLRHGLEPGKHIEAVHPGHFQIEQQHSRQRVNGAICVSSLASQVIDGLLAIVDGEKGNCHLSMFECHAEQEHIVLIIVGDQNRQGFMHCISLPLWESGCNSGLLREIMSLKILEGACGCFVENHRRRGGVQRL